MTQGHHPVHTGLQKHSIGGVFPYILVGFGDGTWGVQDSAGLYMTKGFDRQRFVSVEHAIGYFKNRTEFTSWSPLRPATPKQERPVQAPARVPPFPPSIPPSRHDWYGESGEAAPVEIKLNIFDMALIRGCLRLCPEYRSPATDALYDRLRVVGEGSLVITKAR